MFSTLRKLIVIFLTMLQFIAPLVHAHASEYRLKQGIHVPGLEHYGTENKTLQAQMKTLQHNVCVNGMIIGIDLGHKQNRIFPHTDQDTNFCLLAPPDVIKVAVFSVDKYVCSPTKLFVHPSLIPSHSPRAPPAP